MGHSGPLFVYFFIFSVIQIEKSVDGVLGIQTQGCWMVSADETMELWRPPIAVNFYKERGISTTSPSYILVHCIKWPIDVTTDLFFYF